MNLKRLDGWIFLVAAVGFGLVTTRHARADADVALCQLHQLIKWGTLGDITAYSVGTTSVNVGDVNLPWVQSTNQHPVIGQTMYRIMDGRIEQIGQSWLKHSFCALQIDSACTAINCPNQGGCLSFLAPGCQDPYAASRNGSQNLLGPKWQVNAFTGVFPYPAANGDQGASGDTTYMRLQVHNADLGIAGAQYVVEGQYVTNADSNAGAQRNNASYRLVNISPAPTYSISFVAGQGTEFEQPAIKAWQDHGLGVNVPDPDVIVKQISVPGEGQFNLGYKVTDNGDGTWHYEYAVHNLYSDRSAGSFTIPIGANVQLTNIGFHDVDYHSGDGPGIQNYDGSDWPVTVGAGDITWSTFESYDDNPNGNAIRWGTMYNFRFDANSGPQNVTGTLGLFKPGSPTEVGFGALGPEDTEILPCPWDLDGSGSVSIDDLLDLLSDWGNPYGTEDLLELLAQWGPCP